jgi:hypothetical protein
MKVCGQLAKTYHSKVALTFAIWRIIMKIDICHLANYKKQSKEHKHGAEEQ